MARMRALRNGLLLQLSACQSAELLTLAGKQRLATRIAELAGGHLGWKNAAASAPVPAPARKGEPAASAAAGNGTAEPMPADAAAPRARPNPVEAVHFSSFIIQ
jgi:hypothetical protein